MKKIFCLCICILPGLMLLSCPVCDRAKAKIAFGSLTHGTLPASNWEYLGVWIVILLVVITAFYFVKGLIRPSDTNADHIKYSILIFEKP